jgi:type III restriction enzyme
MKLHFEPKLDYQLQAIEAVCDLFRGQERCRTEFTVTKSTHDGQGRFRFYESDLGVGNRLELLDDELARNLADVQLRNGLKPSGADLSGDFSVEMETGTGKTYVYLRTIFELNRRYAFTKFVIVVPSVAIKEGVYKTLQITDEHFRTLYSSVPYEYFIYDSSKLGQVRNFATSASIQIMVVTVGAINKKDVNNLYGKGANEPTGGEPPINLIRSTRPIVIVDEPQSVDGGLEGSGRKALEAMNPLCTLRYSATHVDKHHMVYRLDAVDAYERKLVKQIEVASATVQDGHNKPYVRFVKPITKGKRVFGAEVEVDVQSATGVRRKTITVQPLHDLEQATGRDLYKGFAIGQIRAKKGEELLELSMPGDVTFLGIGAAHGDVDASSVQRQMIRRTIREHLEKELRLRSWPNGIKVLSLFFIDTVAKYRTYVDGRPEKGEYARVFEEEYRRAAKLPDYKTLFESADFAHPAEVVHDGYFSIDKKGGWADPDLDKKGEFKNEGSRSDAERAFNLIMKDKERLLSFATPLKFIFSHSALREGWDNPNVFQICSLREMGSERERRQTIGRGLRLCVDQAGARVRDAAVNTLTVIASEGYEEFAENLQKEIEKETGVQFGIVEKHQFAGLSVTAADGTSAPLGYERSKELWEHLRDAMLVDAKGQVQDELRRVLVQGTLELPAEFAAQADQIALVLQRLAGRYEVKDADERRPVLPRKGVLHGTDFKALWDRIKHKTTYRVHFDNEKLIEKCTAGLHDGPPITKTRLQWRKADIAIGKSGVDASESSTSAPEVLEESGIELPDILTDLESRTHLTRRSIQRILSASERLGDFKCNPQAFIHVAAEAINRCKRLALVHGIKYQRLGDEHYYAQELFEQHELSGYLKSLLATTKSVYEHVVHGSGVERTFVEHLERNEAVKVYAKLPGWFKVPTPLGSYNPDWAVLIEIDGAERLYFVVETKSSLYDDDLRSKESGKIDCGKAHFEALKVSESPAQYMVATTVEEMLVRASMDARSSSHRS